MDSTSSQRVVTFGEIMLRLSTPGFQRFVQASAFDVTFGGGEANVAASLAQFGIDAAFVSKVPAHDIGQAAINHLRRFGVDTAQVLRGGPRLGTYFLETGASQRPSKVVYDRAGSSVALIEPEELDPEAIFDRASWFHFTGITPALGGRAADAVAKLAAAAQERGVRVSCDLNFRAKLWTQEQARATMRPLMEHVDVCICNEEDADRCLGVHAEGSDVDRGALNLDGYRALAATLRDDFAFQTVAITLRESISASRNLWSAVIADHRTASTPYHSTKYDIQIIDRVGGGDSFAAGLIAALVGGADADAALEFAVAASCLKQTIPGDFNHVSRDEVERMLSTGGTGRVVR
jgi:2-dehydro-3-deoxygluconokinase